MVKILLVEDDPHVSQIQRQVLEELGHAVDVVEDGASARQYTEEQRPDLIVLDLMLPDTDGLVLCTQLKSIADIPIVVCSGTSRPRDTVLAFKLGADDFIAKPFDINEFEERIKAVLRRRANPTKDPPPSDQS